LLSHALAGQRLVDADEAVGPRVRSGLSSTASTTEKIAVFAPIAEGEASRAQPW
jgi:hypothetical protein